jgi:hypothetical protein
MTMIRKFTSHRHLGRPLAVRLVLEALEDRSLPSVTTGVATPEFVVTSALEASPEGGPTLGSGALTPAQLQSAYNFPTSTNGTLNGTGQTIAIIDAYNDPNIQSDLATYDAAYNIPAGGTLTVDGATASGLTSTLPGNAGNTGWDVETSLDVELAHAQAPGANILLVEANSASFTDLLNAVNAAKTASVSGSPVSVVSMSWGGSEFSGETSYDSDFTAAGVTFIASAGDNGSPSIYPSYSANVISVGGTSLTVNSSGGYSSETVWDSTGGGISVYESRPSYQNGVVTQSSTKRTAPDIAYDADPNTGVGVYDSYSEGGWVQVGGTSLSAPSWAAIIAIANQARVAAGESALAGPSSTTPGQALTYLYQASSASSTSFHDITTGSNGTYSAGTGYDLVTGIGTPNVSNLVSYLVTPSGGSGSGGSGSGGSGSGGSGSGGSGSPGTMSFTGPSVVLEGGYESYTGVAVTPSPYEVNSLTVTVNLNYNGPDSNLALYLESPSGTVVDLAIFKGGSSRSGYQNITFATGGLTLGNSAPTAGDTYAPQGSLAQFDNTNGAGDWYFVVVTYGSRRYTGEVTTWSLNITGTPGQGGSLRHSVLIDPGSTQIGALGNTTDMNLINAIQSGEFRSGISSTSVPATTTPNNAPAAVSTPTTNPQSPPANGAATTDIIFGTGRFGDENEMSDMLFDMFEVMVA